jgi:hypothetical protein
MGRVTADTDRDVWIVEPGETPAMHRRGVLGNLIYTERGVVLLHELGVGMAPSAQRGDLPASGLSQEAAAAVEP